MPGRERITSLTTVLLLQLLFLLLLTIPTTLISFTSNPIKADEQAELLLLVGHFLRRKTAHLSSAKQTGTEAWDLHQRLFSARHCAPGTCCNHSGPSQSLLFPQLPYQASLCPHSSRSLAFYTFQILFNMLLIHCESRPAEITTRIRLGRAWECSVVEHLICTYEFCVHSFIPRVP